MFKKLFKKKKKKAASQQNERDFSVEQGVTGAVDLSDRFCPNPFTHFELYDSGKMHVCCSAWLETPIGDANQDDPVAAWNSKTAQDIRASIHDGSFRYCNQALCPSIQNGSLPRKSALAQKPKMRAWVEHQTTVMEDLPTFINFCNDLSCNLSCPSCRLEKIMVRDGVAFEQAKRLNETVVRDFLRTPTNRHFRINVTGSGDPFASKIYREMLSKIDGSDFPNLRINLQTNGVLFTPSNWRRISKLHKNLGLVLISLDAANKETYAVTRQGGHWETLLSNIRFLVERRRDGLIRRLRLDFVVQAENFREMGDFARLAQGLGVDGCYYSLLTDWKTWPRDVFLSKAVWRKDHPDFEAFLEALRDPDLASKHVDMGNLSEVYKYALSQNRALSSL